MDKGKFNEHCNLQLHNLWTIMASHEAKSFSPDWLGLMAHDLRLVCRNIEELVDIYEKESTLNGSK